MISVLISIILLHSKHNSILFRHVYEICLLFSGYNFISCSTVCSINIMLPTWNIKKNWKRKQSSDNCEHKAKQSNRSCMYNFLCVVLNKKYPSFTLLRGHLSILWQPGGWFPNRLTASKSMDPLNHVHRGGRRALNQVLSIERH